MMTIQDLVRTLSTEPLDEIILSPILFHEVNVLEIPYFLAVTRYSFGIGKTTFTMFPNYVQPFFLVRFLQGSLEFKHKSCKER